MQAIAIGRFQHQPVGRRQPLRRQHDRIIRTTHIATESDAAPGALHPHTGCTQDMARALEGEPERADAHRFAETCGAELLHHLPRILGGVERLGRMVLAVAVTVGVARVFLLQMSTVCQQDVRQFAGGRSGPYRAVKAFAHQSRQKA